MGSGKTDSAWLFWLKCYSTPGEPRLTKSLEAFPVTPWSLVSLVSGPTSGQHRPPSSHEQITLETVAYAEGCSSLQPSRLPVPAISFQVIGRRGRRQVNFVSAHCAAQRMCIAALGHRFSVE